MRSAADERLAAVRDWCRAHGLRLCVLFGSRASGRARPESDYDLAVRATMPPEPVTRVAWQAELEQILDTDVSLVMITPDTPPVLGWEIARAGRLVYEAEPGLWAHERARLWHLYNDAEPHRRALAESLRRYAEEVRRAS